MRRDALAMVVVGSGAFITALAAGQQSFCAWQYQGSSCKLFFPLPSQCYTIVQDGPCPQTNWEPPHLGSQTTNDPPFDGPHCHIIYHPKNPDGTCDKDTNVGEYDGVGKCRTASGPECSAQEQ